MKKLMLFAAVAAVLSFVSCKKAEDKSVAVDETAATVTENATAAVEAVATEVAAEAPAVEAPAEK